MASEVRMVRNIASLSVHFCRVILILLRSRIELADRTEGGRYAAFFVGPKHELGRPGLYSVL